MLGPSGPRDWIEFLGLLNEHGVRYLIAGGQAVIFHVGPRATADLDLLIGPEPRNVGRLRSALRVFMGDEPASKAIAMYKSHRILMIGAPPWKIDLTNKMDGMSFAAAWRGRVLTHFAEVPAAVVGLNEMIRAKRAVVKLNRPWPKGSTDSGDLQALLRLKARCR